MKKTNWLAIVVLGLWMFIAGLWFYTPPPPVEYRAGSEVIPTHVKAGESFIVIRNFTVHKTGTIRITRVLQRGDCKARCDIIDLPASVRYVEKGKVEANTRPIVVPSNTPPGKWALIFVMHWQDRWGREYDQILPPLSIEVIK